MLSAASDAWWIATFQATGKRSFMGRAAMRKPRRGVVAYGAEWLAREAMS